ncbi:hypothetical protein [Streptomyces cucumeris]|uniref:hypothetical protein n=1 Tax=Streptomyces cucumeris TaxID=2962890 RepID=UPI0020C87DC6|nr:hypothetical protein [Streptomyces sp. NEAU-Y11]MCP9211523.1 hypothetical protein [Streptomyces sp. NEAU-Y11]
MVNARTYPLWQQLIATEGLPDEALPAVVEALCTTSRAFYGVDNRGEEWRKRALATALPALVQRATDPALRRRVLEQADDKQVADLADQGVVTAADLPVILRSHRPTPGLVIGLARHPGQVDDAISLLPQLHDTDLKRVVDDWNPNRYRRNAEPFPPMPQALFDAVLEYALGPLARLLRHPGQHERWGISGHPTLDLPLEFGEGAPWRILATCPDRWPTLVRHPVFGTAVQHLLLDHAEVEARRTRMAVSGGESLSCGEQDAPAERPEPAPALGPGLLRACLPALCLPEMAGLPKPSVTARHRLHRIAERVRYNPSVMDIAAEQLHAAADECVRRGRLLAPPRMSTNEFRGDIITVAQDLARLSANPKHLAKACALLTMLEQPAVVSAPPSPRLSRFTEGTDLLSPVRLLESNFQHRRVAALLFLAGNPHTPRIAVTETLPTLHPLELSWIGHQSDVPCWLHTAAAALAPADDTEAVLRLLTDDELDRHPDPCAVLQSWLDAPETDGLWTSGDVYRSILDSRHHTLHHLRQLPADEVLIRTEANIAVPHLLAQCGTQPERWHTLLKALDYGPTDEKITFGQLLDMLASQPEPITPA